MTNRYKVLAGQRAARQRARRRERRVARLAEHLAAGGKFTAADSCCVCGRRLVTAEAIERGLGDDCWAAVSAILAEPQP